MASLERHIKYRGGRRDDYPESAEFTVEAKARLVDGVVVREERAHEEQRRVLATAEELKRQKERVMRMKRERGTRSKAQRRQQAVAALGDHHRVQHHEAGAAGTIAQQLAKASKRNTARQRAFYLGQQESNQELRMRVGFEIPAPQARWQMNRVAPPTVSVRAISILASWGSSGNSDMFSPSLVRFPSSSRAPR